MRCIKFRGREQYGNQWVYGYYVQGEMMNASTGETSVRHMIETYGHRIDIDPETLGQYTGQKDKNGVEIYEGDVVKSIRGKFVIGWGDEHAGFEVFQPYRGTLLFLGYLYTDMSVTEDTTEWETEEYEWEWEVIGNIHDNPELLER